jgi:uncharacterized membrane protein
MKNIFKPLLSICISMFALFFVMFFLFSYSNAEVNNTEANIILEYDNFDINENANAFIDLIMSTNINVLEDTWLLACTQEILTATSVSQNTIDYDQNEFGGTVNFLLIPE